MATPPRIFVDHTLHPGPILLEGAAAKRLGSVLRLGPGDTFHVFCGDGREYQATVDGPVGKRLAATVGEIVRQEPRPALEVELYCGLVRATRFDWVVEKATEAGVDVLWPLVTARSARGDSPSKSRLERWERLAIEAAEQSGRLYVPVVQPAIPFERYLGREGVVRLLPDLSGEPWGAVESMLPVSGTLAIAIGPEGGFTPEEVAAARALGALVVRLGPNTLRTETAATVATALVRSRG